MTRDEEISAFLETKKSEIIETAVENAGDRGEPIEPNYDELAATVAEYYEEDLPLNVRPEEIAPTLETWSDDFMDAIRESFEPTALEEAWQDIRDETARRLNSWDGTQLAQLLEKI